MADTALLHFNNNLDDAAGNFWGTVGAGCAPSAAQSKFGGYSLLCPSSSGYLYAASTPGLLLAGSDFTIECWINTTFGSTKTIVGKWLSSYEWIFYLGSTTLSFGCGYSYYVHATLASTAAGVWHHVAVCRQGTAVSMYQNGARIGTGTIGSFNNYTDEVRIGSNSGSNFFNGYIDELRISKVARYTGTTYTVPTAEFVYDPPIVPSIPAVAAGGAVPMTLLMPNGPPMLNTVVVAVPAAVELPTGYAG